MENSVEYVKQLVADFGLRIVTAAVIFYIGRWVAGLVKSAVNRVMTKHEMEPMLVSFVESLSYIALMTFTVLAALGRLGIQTTSFIAVLGAAGLAVGLALQGSLANFASGVLILIFRPFKVGDYIEGGGVSGVVEKMHIFTTQLKTPDNKAIIIPNAKITGDNITNYSAKPERRVDLTFGIGYSDDIDKAKRVIREVLDADSRILKDPEPTVGLVELGDSSVNFVVRPWVKTEDYWGVYFDVTEAMKKRFDAEGISIPFPQRDVHVYQHGA